MRHRVLSKRMGTDSDHAKANYRNLAKALIKNGKIKTTLAKAKNLRRFVEKLVTLGKKGTLHARRLAVARLDDKKAVRKLFDEIAPKYKDRPGGYTRIVKAGFRAGDAAPMAYIMFVEEEIEKTSKDKKEVKPKEVEELKEKLETEIKPSEEVKEANKEEEVSSEQENIEKE